MSVVDNLPKANGSNTISLLGHPDEYGLYSIDAYMNNSFSRVSLFNKKIEAPDHYVEGAFTLGIGGGTAQIHVYLSSTKPYAMDNELVEVYKNNNFKCGDKVDVDISNTSKKYVIVEITQKREESGEVTESLIDVTFE